MHRRQVDLGRLAEQVLEPDTECLRLLPGFSGGNDPDVVQADRGKHLFGHRHELVHADHALDQQRCHDQHRQQAEQGPERQRTRHVLGPIVPKLPCTDTAKFVAEPDRPLPAIQFIERLGDDAAHPLQYRFQ